MSITHENHLYRESGLNHVTLLGHEIRRCRACGYDEQVFHRLGPLHHSIALAIARKPAALAGSEIRFLRAWMGWSGKDFAAHMGVAPATVSRWERGRLAMGATADRLLRLIAVWTAEERDYSLEVWKHLGRVRQPFSLKVDTRTLAATWQPKTRRSSPRARAG
jgi:DNA-binding transcriptional regulator YiaG